MKNTRNSFALIGLVLVGIISGATLITPTVSAHGSAQDHAEHKDSDWAVSVSIDSEQLDKMKADAQARATEAKERVEKARSEAEKRREELKTNAATAKSKLSDAKQRICEQRKTVINNTLDRIGKRGYRHIEVIDRVSERTQAFYKTQNLTIANYDALLSDIAAAKVTADAAAKAVQDAQADFGCDGSGPKDASGSFSALVQARADAVKAYRDAAKTLVEAVKAAAQAQKAKETGMIPVKAVEA